MERAARRAQSAHASSAEASPPTLDASLVALLRDERPRILARLIRLTGDFDLAEDALSDALEVALARWPHDGTPASPVAWLTTVARRKLVDRQRRDQILERKLPLIVDEVEIDDEDDRLRLIFTCCHPALPMEARVALTLRTLGGLTTPEIARAFLVPQPTMAQRMVRAQRKIQEAAIPYEIPPPERLHERLDGVLAVVYLIFNEGYIASEGPLLLRPDLAEQALALGDLIVELMPRESEPLGLLALMLFQHARAPARIGADGMAVSLEDQDRTRWDRDLITRGVIMLDRAMRLGRPGPYQIQAAIASFHARAASAADTDWLRICHLYDALFQVAPGPVVALNRAAAHGMAHGAEIGLAMLDDGLHEALADYPPFHAARADLMRRAGRGAEALAAYRQALTLEGNRAVRRFIERRIDALSGEKNSPAGC